MKQHEVGPEREGDIPSDVPGFTKPPDRPQLTNPRVRKLKNTSVGALEYLHPRVFKFGLGDVTLPPFAQKISMPHIFMTY